MFLGRIWPPDRQDLSSEDLHALLVQPPVEVSWAATPLIRHRVGGRLVRVWRAEEAMAPWMQGWAHLRPPWYRKPQVAGVAPREVARDVIYHASVYRAATSVSERDARQWGEDLWRMLEIPNAGGGVARAWFRYRGPALTSAGEVAMPAWNVRRDGRGVRLPEGPIGWAGEFATRGAALQAISAEWPMSGVGEDADLRVFYRTRLPGLEVVVRLNVSAVCAEVAERFRPPDEVQGLARRYVPRVVQV